VRHGRGPLEITISRMTLSVWNIYSINNRTRWREKTMKTTAERFPKSDEGSRNRSQG
jgi:hypothetical protein